MTPKEKAKDLVEIYVDVNEFYNLQNNNKVVVRNYNFGKQCVLIAVNELIKETGSKYWYNVKQEIENI